MNPIILASNNAKKIQEIKTILNPSLNALGFEMVPQGDLQIPEAPEPFDTFFENALTKARHASRLSGHPALSDDSGLIVPALNGLPGVHSAYYAGLPRSDERNNQKLLAALENQANRHAAFVCCLVLVRHEKDPLPLIATGIWHGLIAQSPLGTNGFGYDPLFYLPTHHKTSAQLTSAEKNGISHRALALQNMLTLIEKDWSLTA